MVDTMDRLANTEPGRLAALEMLCCAGVRLLVARDGTDTVRWARAWWRHC
ncbi:hypothetical protein AB1484_36595 [Parafrankia sp. FMc6]